MISCEGGLWHHVCAHACDATAEAHVEHVGGINFHKLESVQASTRCELSRIFNSFSLPLALNRVYLG